MSQNLKNESPTEALTEEPRPSEATDPSADERDETTNDSGKNHESVPHSASDPAPLHGEQNEASRNEPEERDDDNEDFGQDPASDDDETFEDYDNDDPSDGESKDDPDEERSEGEPIGEELSTTADGPLVVGVRFQPAGRVYDYAVGDLTDLKPGEAVIVEVDRAQAFTRVATPPHHKKIPRDQRLSRILRKATPRDEELQQTLRQREREAKVIAEETIRRHDLPMKLIRVEFLHSQNKAIFYFVTEKRVDFRDLVRDLAGLLRIRIEMRQVGIRDEAKMIGGLGPCGLRTCCNHWLVDFRPVSIKQAKEQNLSLNPQKVSGLCGRLMCCLEYESEQYRDMQSGLPKVGKKADTWMGRGRIMEINIFHNTMRLELDSGQFAVIALEDLNAWKEDPEAFQVMLKEREEQERKRSLSQNVGNFGMSGQESPLAPSSRTETNQAQSGDKSRQPRDSRRRERPAEAGNRDSSDGAPQGSGRRRGRGRSSEPRQGTVEIRQDSAETRQGPAEANTPATGESGNRQPASNADRRPRRPRRDEPRPEREPRKEGGLIISAQTQSGEAAPQGATADKPDTQDGVSSRSRRRRPRGGRGGGQAEGNAQANPPSTPSGEGGEGAPKPNPQRQGGSRSQGSPTGRRRRPRGGGPRGEGSSGGGNQSGNQGGNPGGGNQGGSQGGNND